MQNYKIDNWQYHPDIAILKNEEATLPLKPLLNKLLLHFVHSPNILFRVSDLKQQVWQQEFLTDSAVKKAISELRQQLRHISSSDVEYIKNQPGKGYQLDAEPEILQSPSIIKSIQKNNSKNRLFLGTFSICLACFALLWFIPLSDEQQTSPDGQGRTSRVHLSENSLSQEALTLYLQGKSLYYKEGDSHLVEQRFKQSIKMDPNANPSHGALLNLWGLKLRSVKLHQRSVELQSKVDSHIQDLKQNPDYMTPDILVSLAKYYLVNEGDPAKAYSILKRNSNLESGNENSQLNTVYDPHIYAFTLALHGDKAQSQQIMTQAEQRFPARNVILWYKAFVSLINNETNQAMQEAQWAQRLAPNWYPLVFVASHILNSNTAINKREKLAWAHLAEFEPVFIERDLSQYNDFAELLRNLKSIPQDANFEPFEVEILYLLGLYYDHTLIQLTAREWITKHYPEKQMMLTIIDALFAVSASYTYSSVSN